MLRRYFLLGVLHMYGSIVSCVRNIRIMNSDLIIQHCARYFLGIMK